MAVDKIALIFVIVAALAYAGIWLGGIIVVGGWLAIIILIPVCVVAYILGRVISQRLGNKEDDHYDRIDR
ncbi:MAG: hypothetical protein RIM72_08385 [Alphaproteobacteria bacterium]